MSKKYHGPKWLAWATMLSVFGGIAMIIVGSVNGINGLATAGLVVAFGLTMVLNVGTAIYAVIKSVKKDGQKYPKTSTPQNRAGCIIGVCILILFISVPLVATVFFARGKEAIGGAIIGSLFAAVILAIIIANVKQKAKGGNAASTYSGGTYYDDEDDDEDNNEKSSFDLYMEADDAFEEFIDGDADIYLDADEYEKIIDESDKAYNEYMIDCDKYGGESQGEILYAKKLHEIIRKYKLIIKSRNPEYEIADSLDDIDGKKQLVATLVDALKQVAKKKEKAEHKKIGMEIIEREKEKLEMRERAKLEKPDYSVLSVSPKKEKQKSSLELSDIFQRVAQEKEKLANEEKIAKNSENLNFDEPKIEKKQISSKKPTYAQPDYSAKTEQSPTEEKAEKVENVGDGKQENAAAPKRATIAYKGIKKK